ncbi:RloB family protein [Niabella aquatica]
MSDFRRPSKTERNLHYLRSIGLGIQQNPYLEDRFQKAKLFLIICEGLNTEPEYFRSFRVPGKTVIIEGGRGSKSALVDYAILLRSHPEYQDREIWCVYDFDIKADEAATQREDFNQSIVKANQYGLRVAWSNDAFELWFLLHYQKIDTALNRNNIYEILKEKWGLTSFRKQSKQAGFCKTIYELLGGHDSKEQRLAVRRAKELHESYQSRSDFYLHCPCTTVYQLVEELNKYVK